MSVATPISRADFDTLLEQHRQLIEIANDLEYSLYRLGELPADERITDCQRAGGSLLGLLRDYLFRCDQQIMPLAEASKV